MGLKKVSAEEAMGKGAASTGPSPARTGRSAPTPLGTVDDPAGGHRHGMVGYVRDTVEAALAGGDGPGDNRDVVYEEDDGEGGKKVVYRASGFGNCMRGLVAGRLGMTPMDAPDMIKKAWAQGHANEDLILHLLKVRELKVADRRGKKSIVQIKLLSQYDIEMRGYGQFEGGQLALEMGVPAGGQRGIIRGHTDGVGEIYSRWHEGPEDEVAQWPGIGTRMVVEAKAFSEGTYEKYLKQGLAAFSFYQLQNSIYMHATGLPLLFVIGIKDSDGVVQDIVTDFYPTPMWSLGKIKARAAKIQKLVDGEGVAGACEYDQYPCAFYYIHEDKDDRKAREAAESELELGDVPQVEEIAKFAKEYAEAKAAVSALTAAKKKGDDWFKAWIDAHPEWNDKAFEVDTGDGVKVVVKVKATGRGEVEHEAVEAKEVHHPAVEAWVEKVPGKEAWVEKKNGTVTVSADVLINDEEGEK